MYADSHVIVICFAVNNEQSFNSVKEKWIPEVRHLVPEAPIALCGTKIDTRDSGSTGTRIITREEGEAYAKELNCITYVETSAVTGQNIDKAFKVFLAVSFIQEWHKKDHNPNSKHKKCSVQ